jgi:hypothetical protein
MRRFRRGVNDGQKARLAVRLYPEQATKLDTWIAKQSPKPSRPAAIRRLMMIGLQSFRT